MNTLLYLTATIFLVTTLILPVSLHAQDAICGPPPSLPTSIQNDEGIKGQLQSQANLLSKLVGKAELSGQIEAVKKELYQSSSYFFAAQKDAYLAYIFCVLITRDNSLSVSDKLKAIQEYKNSTPSNKSGALTAPITEETRKEDISPHLQLKEPTDIVNQGPITWDLDSQFLVVIGGGLNAKINGVLLQGTSTTFVAMKEAYAISGITGHRRDLMANIEYQGYYSVNNIDIPPHAPVWLEILFNPPLSLTEFRDQWAQFSVTIVYENGTKYNHNFDEDYVFNKLRNIIPGAVGPRVTPKELPSHLVQSNNAIQQIVPKAELNPGPTDGVPLSIRIQSGPGEQAQMIARALESEFQRSGFILDSNRPTIIFNIEVKARTVGRRLDGPDRVTVTIANRWTDPRLAKPTERIEREYDWGNPNSSANNVAEKIFEILLPSLHG